MPRKPLAMIGMSDADTVSALKYVKNQLSSPSSTGGQAPLTTQVELDKLEIARIEQLGGRVSDLDSLIHKVRAGQTVSDAVEDIIRRDVGELRKNAFGDDVDDAKRLQWTREQAWSLFKKMTKKEEVPYYEVLVSMFGGVDLDLD
jgi:succinate dehydrogenase/fumarate reductase flavoprotein subunit